MYSWHTPILAQNTPNAYFGVIESLKRPKNYVIVFSILEKVSEDADLQAKFSQIKDLDEAYALASSAQSGFTKEELVSEMNKIKEAMEENLTDEDMARSAGGDPDTQMISVTVVTVVSEISVVSVGVASAI